MVDVPQWLIIILALVYAPIIGLFLMGIERKLSARFQGRIGPPLFQPYYDLMKLFSKEALVLNRVQILYAYLHLAFMMVTVVLLVLGQDLLLVLFAHAFSTICLILGGMCVRSPYSRIGSHRKIMQMVAYEPIMILMVIGIYINQGSFMGRDVFLLGKPMLLTLPLIFVAFVVAGMIKLDKSPFDVATSHHAHQELVKGITIEYSGPFLGIIELTFAYEVFDIFGVMACLWTTNLWSGLGFALAGYGTMILVDNLTARLTTNWMVRYMWSIPLVLALSNLIWIYK
jgi:formate hydrogenlyase subunit 4